jgi:hypothetical protein
MGMTTNNKIVAVAAVVIILAANGWVLWRSLAGSGSGGRREQAFFTTDDGATYFADDASKMTPFDHNGKPAVLAHVYQANGKRWVAYLEQYTPKARELMEAVQKQQIGSDKLAGVMLKEVKKPGQDHWITPADGKAYIELITVGDPNGGSEQPRPVGPAD